MAKLILQSQECRTGVFKCTLTHSFWNIQHTRTNSRNIQSVHYRLFYKVKYMKILSKKPEIEMLRESEYMCSLTLLGLKHFGIGDTPSKAENNLIARLQKTVDIFRTYYIID